MTGPRPRPPHDLLALTAELVDIPSVSRDEAAITAHLEHELRALGHLDLTRVGDNLTAAAARQYCYGNADPWERWWN